MAIDVTCEATIRAAPPECLAVAADAARWKEWARDLEEVAVIAPFEGDSPLRVEIVIEILGVEKRATIDLVRDLAANALSFVLVESPSLREFTGGVRFVSEGSRTRMAADVHAVLIRQYAPRIERMAGRKIETALTRDFLRHVERAHRAR